VQANKLREIFFLARMAFLAGGGNERSNKKYVVVRCS
jgi:hypothetical protein